MPSLKHSPNGPSPAAITAIFMATGLAACVVIPAPGPGPSQSSTSGVTLAMLPQADSPVNKLSPKERLCLGRTLVGEMRGVQEETEIQAVADVIAERVLDGHWGKDICSVVYARTRISTTKQIQVCRRHKCHSKEVLSSHFVYQFSTHSPNDPSYRTANHAAPGQPQFDRLVKIAAPVIEYRLSGGSSWFHTPDHYFHPKSMKRGKNPVWASNMDCRTVSNSSQAGVFCRANN